MSEFLGFRLSVVLCSLCLLLAGVSCVADDDDDIGDDNGDGDDDPDDDDSHDDDTHDDHTDDDDTDDDDDDDIIIDDDEDDDIDNLPVCSAYFESDSLIEWPDMGDNYWDFCQEDDDYGWLVGTVTLFDGGFTIHKGSFSIQGLPNESVDAPFSNNQSVLVRYGESAGDDGCCDSTGFYVFDESYRLLVAYTWNEDFRIDVWGDITIGGRSEWDEVCRYADGERPPGTDDWIYVLGFALFGYYGESEFDIDRPGQSAFTQDGQYLVNWPVGYGGEFYWTEDEIWSSHSTTIELVAVSP